MGSVCLKWQLSHVAAEFRDSEAMNVMNISKPCKDSRHSKFRKSYKLT